MNETFRALIVAPSPLARMGLAALLEGVITVVGQSDGEDDLADAVDIFQPEVIIWDIGWEKPTMLDQIAAIRGVPLLVLMADTSAVSDIAPALIRAGVRGVLLQNANADALATAVTAVAYGLLVLHAAAADALHAVAIPSPETDLLPAPTLTPREDEVLRLIVDGLPNKTIAQRLGISEHTVKFHVNSIMTKLDAQSRTDAAVRAARLGLVTL